MAGQVSMEKLREAMQDRGRVQAGLGPRILLPADLSRAPGAPVPDVPGKLQGARQRLEALARARMTSVAALAAPRASSPTRSPGFGDLRKPLAEDSPSPRRAGVSPAAMPSTVPMPYSVTEVLLALLSIGRDAGALVGLLPVDATLAVTLAGPRDVTPPTPMQDPATAAYLSPWSSVRIALAAPSLRDLRRDFPDGAVGRQQVGLDDELDPVFARAKYDAAVEAWLSQDRQAARAVLRAGCPNAMRPAMWALALGAAVKCPTEAAAAVQARLARDELAAVRMRPTATAWATKGSGSGTSGSEADTPLAADGSRSAVPISAYLSTCPAASRFDALCAEASSAPLPADLVVQADVQFVANSPDFFLFEETIRAVVLAMLRDTTMERECACAPHPSFKPSPDPSAPLISTPSGLVPFQGLAFLLAPCCFLFREPADVFSVASALYRQALCKAHTLAPDAYPSPAFPGLVACFESILQDADPELFWHVLSLGVAPARLAAPWLFSCFAGALESLQTLLLWDRVIGYGSLVPVAQLAAGILLLRRAQVLASEGPEELSLCLEDVKSVQVVPVLQLVMAAGE